MWVLEIKPRSSVRAVVLLAPSHLSSLALMRVLSCEIIDYVFDPEVISFTSWRNRQKLGYLHNSSCVRPALMETQGDTEAHRC